MESARECSSCKGRGNAPDTVTETCAACSGRGEVRYQRGFIPALRPCGSCKGKGYRVVVPCPTCAGLGTIARPEMISVRTPAGVQNGAVRTIRSAGEYGVGGAGDLLVTIVVKPHEFYRREGSDVLCSVPVTFPELVLGAQIDVPTLEGKVTLKIPPGTPSGKVFRLRGRGLVALGGAGKGDQLVTVDVEVPSEVTPRQRELLAELSTAFGSLPRKQSFLARIRELFG